MKLPKWTKSYKHESRYVDLDNRSIEAIIEELQAFPGRAYLEIEMEEGYCGERFVSCHVRWSRDMTEDEYLKHMAEKASADAAQNAKDAAELERLAKKLGKEVK